MFCSLLGRKFSSKCKHSVKCIKCRMETIRKKKQAMVRYLKKDVADLISGGHETIAFGRMDALIVEINQSSCYDIIEQYCCCILEHLPTMQKERVCPEETVEAIATLIFAAARFPDLPELAGLRHEFAKRYGTHMEAYINEEFAEKMQKKFFPQHRKLLLMQDITQEFSIHWDFKAFEHKISNPSPPTLTAVLKKAENIKEHQIINQARRFEGSIDELENSKSHQFDEKAPLNVKKNGQNTCERSESVRERQRAASMDSRDAKAINILPPYTKFAGDFNETSANQDNSAHSATPGAAKEMDQMSQPNRTMFPERTRAFNPKPPYVKPNVTKNTSSEAGYNGGNYLMNTPFSIRGAATNADFTAPDQAEDEATNGAAVHRRRHLQRAFSDRSRHGGGLS